MSLLLLAAGAFFAVIFIVNSVIQTIRRASKVGYWDIQLAFLVTLVSAAAVLFNYWGDAPDAQLDVWALMLGGAFAAISLVLTLIEVFRPQRLRGSRGIMGLFSGALIAASALGIPFVAAYFALQSDLPTVAPTQVAQADVTAEASAEAPSRGAALFFAIRDAIRQEIEVEDQVITEALEAGTPLSEIVTGNGGDINVVIGAITLAMETWVREGIALGEINQLQGALLLSQLENIVRLAVNSDINRFAERFGRATPAPGETQESVFGVVSPHPTTPPAMTRPAETPAPSATITASPAPTETDMPPSATRTPSPSRTRLQFSTRTPAPTLTPTEALVCQATTTNNLRLRAAPSQDAETLLTIPSNSVIFLSGRDDASLWWQTEFDGQAGWVLGEFLLLSAACPALPALD